MAHRGRLDRLDQLANAVIPDNEENQDCLVQPVVQDQPVREDRRVHVVRMAVLDQQVHRDLAGKPAHVETLEHQESKV